MNYSSLNAARKLKNVLSECRHVPVKLIPSLFGVSISAKAKLSQKKGVIYEVVLLRIDFF